jgi:hypothetical protein
MWQIAAVILGFLLTGLLGNWILQGWQHRSWLRQQQFLGQEKEYLALKDLAAEVADAIGARIYHMRRLLWSIRGSTDEILSERLQAYDRVVTQWNEKLQTYYVRLTLYASFYDAGDLERRIHEPAQAIGAEIEQLVRGRRAGRLPDRPQVVRLERRLNELYGLGFEVNRDILASVEKKRQVTYFGERLHMSKDTLKYFSTWDLIKGLFVSDIDAFAISRPPTDVS